MKHTKKNYPLPGPGEHFQDTLIIEGYPKEKKDLLKKIKYQPVNKDRFSKQKRDMILVDNMKDLKSFPSPDKYMPKVLQEANL